ncbi:SelT/SelW/SelH family protein OS=Stutzerimonas stutzeri OX=316 GN=CXK95_16555 PE=4 SV=1 [Stutzerimonas stutzeri]
MSNGKADIVIVYCTQCQWLLRAAWLAQELLSTFTDDLARVALEPGTGGVFRITCDGEQLGAHARWRLPGNPGIQAAGTRPYRPAAFAGPQRSLRFRTPADSSGGW